MDCCWSVQMLEVLLVKLVYSDRGNLHIDINEEYLEHDLSKGRQ